MFRWLVKRTYAAKLIMIVYFTLLQILLCENSGISQVDVLCNISAIYSFVTIN